MYIIAREKLTKNSILPSRFKIYATGNLPTYFRPLILGGLILVSQKIHIWCKPGLCLASIVPLDIGIFRYFFPGAFFLVCWEYFCSSPFAGTNSCSGTIGASRSMNAMVCNGSVICACNRLILVLLIHLLCTCLRSLPKYFLFLIVYG